MTMTLVVHGHGKWHANDGYAQTPRGISIDFYTEGGKSQYAGFAYEFLLGSGKALTGGAPDSTIGPFRSTPNYTLSRLSQQQFDTAQKYYGLGTLKDDPQYKVLIMKPTANPVKLQTVCALAERTGCSKIIWLACRAVDLAKVGGAALGLNAGQANRHVTPGVLNDHKLEAELKKLQQGY